MIKNKNAVTKKKSRNLSSNKGIRAAKLSKLQKFHGGLELKVQERTIALAKANEVLQAEIAERRQAEEINKFQANILSQVNDAVIAIDNDNRIIYWNNGAERLYNLRNDEVLGRPIEESYRYLWLNPEDEKAAYESLAVSGFWRGKNIHVKKSGEEIYVDASVSVLRDDSGAKIGLLAVVRDVTERKHTEKERLNLIEEIKKRHQQTENLAMNLKKERDTLNIIMENTETQLAYLDSKFNFIRVNSAYAEGSGYKKEELIGRNHFELFPDPENQAIFEKVRDTGEAVEFRAKPFEFKDQPWRGVTYRDWTLSPLKDASGRVDRLVLSLTDVTARIRDEQAMQKALVYAEGIVDTIPEPLLILDSDLRVKTANHAFYKTFKVRVEDTTNKMLYDLGNRQWDIPGLRKLLEDVIPRNKYVQDFEVEHDFPNLGRKIMMLNARRVYLEGKEMILLAIANITERKKMDEIRLENERLISASKARSELLSVMSHELRTPLTSIIGYSILLNEKTHGRLNEKQELYIESILNNGKHLLSLINSILDLAKLEAGKLEMVFEDISVPDTINGSLALMKEKALMQNIQLKKEFDPELTNIKADGQKFKQILFNLLSNALKFSKEEGGVITVSAKKEGEMAKISVSDMGIGIKEEDMPRLFRKFEQLDSGISRKYGGTGLGLAITKQLVEMHGGKITVESRYGEGSTFTFFLPIEGRE